MAFKKNNSSINKNLTVDAIVPAYNEEESVAHVINVIKELDYIDNVIVVNDGSTDNTEVVAIDAGAKVITHKNNQGKGAAIKTGVDVSDADVVAFIDGDIKNLSSEKVDCFIRPILEGNADITKTKFARESGRVTELTAKPLLKFFFPEVDYEQPLSGQFAAKRSLLKKMEFEKDYGVDVGIVLDAEVRGIKIYEVDIGVIKHDMSPLSDLHEMANEVVRSIIIRAMTYGRVAMIDTLGNYIRMSILGLSLIILGLFLLFFVPPVPFQLSLLIGVFGLIEAVFYLVKLIINSIRLFKRENNRNFAKSFIKMHLPIIFVFFVLVIMISTFMSAATIGDNGQISIEATSRNIVIFGQGSENHIAVRGPYVVDNALENESNLIHMPYHALQTLQMSYGDTIIIQNESYSINKTMGDEADNLRLPANARSDLGVHVGDIISNSRIPNVFCGSKVIHSVRMANTSTLDYDITEYYKVAYKSRNASSFDIYIDDELITSSSAIFKENQSYVLQVNDEYLGEFESEDISANNSINFTYGEHNIELIGKSDTLSVRNAVSSEDGIFLNFILTDRESLDILTNTTDTGSSDDRQ
ncbi:glycosyltransferase [uncultured Methanobrevibacter sp.]|uniref:glycosyltransferase n=1 Tax=uncultured Methanobrevibacter sp. TaxID=253161 RepID=UPI0025D8E185|nr:glycosyltransferase [uncultured Methanobrevibacter sp.]